jgi:predicted transcriptional regulator of viral defense system
MNLTRYQQIHDLFQNKNGVISVSDLHNSGFKLYQIQQLLKENMIVRVHHGYYQWIESENTGKDEFIIISRIIPNGIICLTSALSYYGLITTIPRKISIALARGATKPKPPTYPPVQYFYYASSTFTEGMERLEINDMHVRMYNIERTIADSLKFRNKIGWEIVKEALISYLKLPSRIVPLLEHYAKMNRVYSLLRTYLDLLL